MRRRTSSIGTLVVLAAAVPLAGTAHAQDLDCRDFTYQEDAQALFDTDSNDPHRLDEDQGPYDGIACEALPRRAGGHTSSTSYPQPAPTTAPPAPTTAPPTATPTAAPTVPTTPAAVAPTRGVQGGVGGSAGTGPSDWDIGIGAAFLAGGALAAGYWVRRRRT
ncbi:excalibur calcium-binding protein [Streptomyces sp. NPDC005931]|uniref:excalibur calcium-binding protein n=1 Tax=Streptomyces sp. NPDC005931 TaxID=3364737 RepID=UPI00369B3954